MQSRPPSHIRALDSSQYPAGPLVGMMPADMGAGGILHDRHSTGRRVDLVAPKAVQPERGRITIPGSLPKCGTHAGDVRGRLGCGREKLVGKVPCRDERTGKF